MIMQFQCSYNIQYINESKLNRIMTMKQEHLEAALNHTEEHPGYWPKEREIAKGK